MYGDLTRSLHTVNNFSSVNNYQTHLCLCIWGPYVRLAFVRNMLSSWNKVIIILFYSFYITLTKCQWPERLTLLLFALAHTIICLPYDVYICMQSEKNEFIQGCQNVNESVFCSILNSMSYNMWQSFPPFFLLFHHIWDSFITSDVCLCVTLVYV